MTNYSIVGGRLTPTNNTSSSPAVSSSGGTSIAANNGTDTLTITNTKTGQVVKYGVSAPGNMNSFLGVGSPLANEGVTPKTTSDVVKYAYTGGAAEQQFQQQQAQATQASAQNLASQYTSPEQKLAGQTSANIYQPTQESSSYLTSKQNPFTQQNKLSQIVAKQKQSVQQQVEEPIRNMLIASNSIRAVQENIATPQQEQFAKQLQSAGLTGNYTYLPVIKSDKGIFNNSFDSATAAYNKTLATRIIPTTAIGETYIREGEGLTKLRALSASAVEFVSEAGGQIFNSSFENAYQYNSTTGIYTSNNPNQALLPDVYKLKPLSNQEYESGNYVNYTAGRVVGTVAPYFIAPNLVAGVNVLGSQSQEELVTNVTTGIIFAGGAKLLGKLTDVAPLALNKVLYGERGTVTATKTGLVFGLEGGAIKTTLPQLVYNAGLGIQKYGFPSVAAVSIGENLSNIYSVQQTQDIGLIKESTRQLGSSFGGIVLGSKVGDYVGTQLGLYATPFIYRETIKQNTGFNAEQKALGLQAVELSFGKNALPSSGLPVGEFKVGSLDILKSRKFGEVNNPISLESGKKISSAVEKELQLYASEGKDVKVIGSSVVPPQIKGNKPYKLFGDIDVGKGSAALAERIALRINELGIKDITAITKVKDTEVFGGKAFVELQYKGKRIGSELGKGEMPEFLNVTLSLRATERQYNIFGEPFKGANKAFIQTTINGKPSDVRVFNIRDQLRAKITGAYFGGRAKDIIDIKGIIEGTKDYAPKPITGSIYKQSLELGKFIESPKYEARLLENLSKQIAVDEYGLTKEYSYLSPKESRNTYVSYKELKQTNSYGVSDSYSLKEGYKTGNYNLSNYVGTPYVPVTYAPAKYVKPVEVFTKYQGVYTPPTYSPTNYTPNYTPTTYNPTYTPTTYKSTTYNPPYTPPIITETISKKKRQDEEEKLNKKLRKGFVAFERKKGKFVKISGNILPEQRAYQEAANRVLGNLSRSITVKQVGFTDQEDIMKANLSAFRQRKPNTKIMGDPVFVQRTETLLKSSGEKQDIQQAKKIKRMFK